MLEDRKGRKRSFPLGPGFWYEGRPVTLVPPAPEPATTIRRTASGSVAGADATRAKVALPSRIYVEGRHDAELVEKIWGDDLRHVGVVVEFLGGVDELPEMVAEFRPEPGRRLGVLVDHLVPGQQGVPHRAAVPRVTVRPARAGARPSLRRRLAGREAGAGGPAVAGPTSRAMSSGNTASARCWGCRTTTRQTSPPPGERSCPVNSWRDLEQPLLNAVEQLIDFVTVEP